MRPPIVITESYDISIHPSVKHVEAFLEPVDVRDGMYTAYDCEGHLLDLTARPVERERHFLFFKWTARYECVIIGEHDPVSDRSVELRSKLIYYLTHKGVSEKESQEASLEELIRMIGKRMPWRL